MNNTPSSIEEIEKIIPILLTDKVKKKIVKVIESEKRKYLEKFVEWLEEVEGNLLDKFLSQQKKGQYD